MTDAAPTPPPATSCRACGEPLVPRRPAAPEVTRGTVAVVAAGPTGWTCPRRATAAPGDVAAAGSAVDGGPDGAPADHDLLTPTPAEARDAVRGALDVARRTALRRRLRCGVCDEPFVLPGRRTQRSVTVTGASPAVTLTFDLPVLRCTNDAVDNVPPEALDDALAATAVVLGHGS